MIHKCIGEAGWYIYIFYNYMRNGPAKTYSPREGFSSGTVSCVSLLPNQPIEIHNLIKAGPLPGVAKISQSTHVFKHECSVLVWLRCTHVGPVLTCYLEPCLYVSIVLKPCPACLKMSSSFFVKTKQNPKLGQKGKRVEVPKRKVSKRDC